MLNISTPFQLKRHWIWTNCNMNYTGTANAGKMTNFGVHFGFASPTLASQAGNTKRVHNFRGTLCKKSQQQWAVEDSEKCSNIRFPADHHIFTFHTNFQVLSSITLRWLKHQKVTLDSPSGDQPMGWQPTTETGRTLCSQWGSDLGRNRFFPPGDGGRLRTLEVEVLGVQYPASWKNLKQKPAYPHFEQTKPVWKFTHYRQLLRVLAGKRLQKSGHVVTFWWLSNIFSGKFSHFFHEELTPPNTTSMLSPRCCWILPKCARKKNQGKSCSMGITPNHFHT